MAWNMIIHLSLAEEMFIKLMEVMKPGLFGENDSCIPWNLISPRVPIRLTHILADMIRYDYVPNAFHQLPGESVIIIIGDEVDRISGFLNVLVIDLLAVVILVHEAHVRRKEIGFYDGVVVVVFGTQGFVEIELREDVQLQVQSVQVLVQVVFVRD